MGMIQQAKDKPVLTSVAAGAMTLTTILGVAKALDIRLIPWATASEIEAIDKKMDERDKAILDAFKDLRADQKRSEAATNVLLREFWEKRLEEADEELKANPNSRTARAQRLEAKRNIEMIDLNTAGVPPHAQLPDQ